MSAGQVRLDAEVAAVLQQRAIDSGRSLSGEANAWLRRALGLAPGAKSPAALAHPAPPAQPATISAPKGRGALARPPAGLRSGWHGAVERPPR